MVAIKLSVDCRSMKIGSGRSISAKGQRLGTFQDEIFHYPEVNGLLNPFYARECPSVVESATNERITNNRSRSTCAIPVPLSGNSVTARRP
jgi:hypothetical protein